MVTRAGCNRPWFNTWYYWVSLVCIHCLWIPSSCFSQSERSPDLKAPEKFHFSKVEDGVEVYFGKDLFTQLRTQPFAKPILYPIYVDKKIGMTRNWPMQRDAKKEPVDHPHHKSLWTGHIINGVDFWTEHSGKVIVQDVQLDEANQRLMVKSDWIRTKDDKRICSDQTLYSFGTHDNVRWIDVKIEFVSSEHELRFEDTKEGTFAVRTHPNQQLSAAKEGGPDAAIGKARNSEGIQGKAIWGKKAKWVLYQGVIDETPVAIAMFDHCDNLRFPTTWHARDYGLVSANPFGLHEFTGKPPGAGKLIVAQGKTFSLRYRILFIKGEPSDDQIETWYSKFVQNDDPTACQQSSPLRFPQLNPASLAQLLTANRVVERNEVKIGQR